jgi:hypothetical protein
MGAGVTLEQIAQRHRVRARKDECGDPVIAGKKGQLYVDGEKVCLLLLDARPVKRSRLEALGGRVWQGDISPNRKGLRAQDAKVTGISQEKIAAALRITGCRRRRVLTEELREQAMRALDLARISAEGAEKGRAVAQDRAAGGR